jgi:hypothetical protein
LAAFYNIDKISFGNKVTLTSSAIFLANKIMGIANYYFGFLTYHVQPWGASCNVVTVISNSYQYGEGVDPLTRKENLNCMQKMWRNK